MPCMRDKMKKTIPQDASTIKRPMTAAISILRARSTFDASPPDVIQTKPPYMIRMIARRPRNPRMTRMMPTMMSFGLAAPRPIFWA